MFILVIILYILRCKYKFFYNSGIEEVFSLSDAGRNAHESLFSQGEITVPSSDEN